jgi:hypothetical protein
MSARTIEEALRIMNGAKTTIIKLETQRETALKSIKEEIGASTIEEGDRLLQEMDVELTKLEKEQASSMKVLEEEFPWE